MNKAPRPGPDSGAVPTEGAPGVKAPGSSATGAPKGQGGAPPQPGAKQHKGNRSRNNSFGEGKPRDGGKSRSRTNSLGEGKPKKKEGSGRPENGSSRGRGGRAAPNRAQARKPAKTSRDYENEEWRTVYIGFIERGTTEEELLEHFKDSGEVERLTLKDGFAFMLFKEEKSVELACRLDGSNLRGLNLRVAPRKEKPPQIAGDVLLDLDMRKFRNEKQEKLFTDLEEFLKTFHCVGSFSQDRKEPNSIIIPGCPPILDWTKMEAEEGEITLVRQAENAPELNTLDSILKSVEQCSTDLDLSKVHVVANRQCLMKFLAPVDPSIEYTTNKCFRLTATRSSCGPIFLNLESKWHPTMGTAKSFQDAVTVPLPDKVKNLAHPGIFYRINTFELGKLTVMVRTQVHAEDDEPMLEFEADSDTEQDNSEDFFDIEERNGEAGETNGTTTTTSCKPAEGKKAPDSRPPAAAASSTTFRVDAAEFVPPVHTWNTFKGTDLRWVKNDGVFTQPESRYELKTVDIGGNFWEYNAEKTFYQMLLGGVDYLLLGVLLNNEYVINKEEYDLNEVHAKVLGTKNPTDATLVLSKMEKILSKIVELSSPLQEGERLEIVFDGKREHLTFYKIPADTSSHQ